MSDCDELVGFCRDPEQTAHCRTQTSPSYPGVRDVESSGKAGDSHIQILTSALDLVLYTLPGEGQWSPHRWRPPLAADRAGFMHRKALTWLLPSAAGLRITLNL